MIKKKIERLHDDEIYIRNNLDYEPKEYFKKLLKLLKKENFLSLLDIGCSNGELLNYLNKNIKDTSFHGVDISKKLLKNASEISSKEITFSKKDISKKNCKIGKYDRIICAGVLSIFDDPELIFKNIFLNLNQNGKVFIFGYFNKFPYDVIVKYEDVLNKKNKLQSGWNVYSLNAIELICKKHKKNIKIHKFNMPFELKKNIKDPIRTWTQKINGKVSFTNALGLILNGYWIEIY